MIYLKLGSFRLLKHNPKIFDFQIKVMDQTERKLEKHFQYLWALYASHQSLISKDWIHKK